MMSRGTYIRILIHQYMTAALQENIDITHLSGYRTSARTRYYYEIRDARDLEGLSPLIARMKEEGVPRIILGEGLNCLFAFDLYPGLIIKNSLISWEYDEGKQLLRSDSGVRIWEIAETLERDHKNALWYRFIGLPGTVGGAVYGNAGCFGLEIENNFLFAEVMDMNTGERHVLDKASMQFRYRNSFLKEASHGISGCMSAYFLISATFDLSKKVEKYHSDADVRLFRETKQPKGYTCGSFFKNPSKEQSAGFLIESIGYRGYTLGTARFSDLHANFLMSSGDGDWRDLITLIKEVQYKVHETYGIELIPEVQIIDGK